MEEIAIVVRLKAPDPAAMTALSTFRRINPGECPDRLERYDYWLFIDPAEGKDTVRGIVSRYHDIVNPNKQIWSFAGEESQSAGSDEGMVWIDVLVTDKVDSVSENWTAILHRNRSEIERVRCSVLWRFGFPSGISFENARKKVLELTVSTHRDNGLLANPVSQKIDPPVPSRI